MNDIVTLFQWNTWANSRYRNIFRKMEFDALKIDTPYGNMLERIVHIFASFEMWYKRMHGESPNGVIKADHFDTWEELERKWIEFDNLLINFVNGLTEKMINSNVTYTSLDGSVYTRKMQHILLHLTAHPNYHRGQLSAMFKLLKLPSLPATDMVIYFLENS